MSLVGIPNKYFGHGRNLPFRDTYLFHFYFNMVKKPSKQCVSTVTVTHSLELCPAAQEALPLPLKRLLMLFKLS